MDKDKSIIEKFTETVKGLADSASEALKSEEPPKADQTAAAYMPFAAEGMVSDPLLVPPVAAQPVRKKRRVAKKAAKRSGTAKTSARKAAKKSATTRSRKSTRKAEKASARKATAKKAGRVSAKKRSKKAATRRR
jgi:hypothetical protein